MLGKAILCVLKAHAGQTDKASAPYILHPLRIMMKMDSSVEMIVAVLHDVIEDSPLILEDLRAEGFSEEILPALDHLTRRENEEYEVFIKSHKTPGSCRGMKRLSRRDGICYDRACDSEKVPIPSIRQSTISSGYRDIGEKSL